MSAGSAGDGCATEQLKSPEAGPAHPHEADAGEDEGNLEAVANLRCARHLGLGSKIAAIIVAILQWIGSTQISWPAGTIAEISLGVVAAVVLVFHVANTHTRIEIEHWKCSNLQPFLVYELGLGWAVPLAVLVTVLVFPPTWPVLLILAVTLIPTVWFYEWAEEEICRIVAEEKLKQGTRRFGESQPYKRAHSGRTIDQMAEIRRPGVQKFLGFWVKPAWWPGLSRTRTVITYAMLICAFIAFTASADVFVQDTMRPPAADPPGKGSDAQKKDTAPAAGTAGSGEGAAQENPAPAPEDTDCPHPPSFGAPAWAKSDLEALYYGTKELKATPPPGNEEGGCTGRAIVPAAQHGTFVYTVGRNAVGEIRSLATVSRAFAPSIFLAPSAQLVLNLIKHGVAPLGGYPVIDVAGGDAIGVTSDAGTYALVRDAKHLPHSTLAVGYSLLPPTAASAWVGSMKELGSWLWPEAPRAAAGIREYPLRLSRDAENPIEVITYRTTDGSARRDQYTYLLPQPQIGERELQQLAHTAR